MPHFKKERFSVQNAAGHTEELVVDISISADGLFYANLPQVFEAGFNGVFSVVKGKIKVTARTYDELSGLVRGAIKSLIAVEVKEEAVIQFNIKSDVSFAVDDVGNIFPNAGFPGAKWASSETERKMYGGHHSAAPSQLGYGLVIGAKAMTKITYKFRDKVKVDYKPYHKEGDAYNDKDDPAYLLNSWCSFSLGTSPREIPYSDESALFFHNLMKAMAELSRTIQSATFNNQQLLGTIASQGFALLGNSAAKPPKAEGAEIVVDNV